MGAGLQGKDQYDMTFELTFNTHQLKSVISWGVFFNICTELFYGVSVKDML